MAQESDDLVMGSPTGSETAEPSQKAVTKVQDQVLPSTVQRGREVELSAFGKLGEIVSEIDLLLHVCATRVEDREEHEHVSSVSIVSAHSVFLFKDRNVGQLVTVWEASREPLMRASLDQWRTKYSSPNAAKAHRILATSLVFLHAVVYANFEVLKGEDSKPLIADNATFGCIMMDPLNSGAPKENIFASLLPFLEQNLLAAHPDPKITDDEAEPYVNYKVTRVCDIDVESRAVVASLDCQIPGRLEGKQTAVLKLSEDLESVVSVSCVKHC
ncbi:unnamed protein product [Amoebophrya sp. A25]|nr:unnamed protein product [Amoebophrya sp. A25]|eukprot:GSA25T00022708001.1